MWDELLETRQKPRPVLVWCCDCQCKPNKKGEFTFSRMFQITVRKDETCSLCGYFAVKLDKRILLRQAKHSAILRKYRAS